MIAGLEHRVGLGRARGLQQAPFPADVLGLCQTGLLQVGLVREPGTNEEDSASCFFRDGEFGR